MTKYTIYNGEIINDDGLNVGWIDENITSSLECLAVIKLILEQHGHSFRVGSFSSKYICQAAAPKLRGNELGVYVTSKLDDMNYAYFSKEMHCHKLCANAVLKVIA